MSSPDYFYDILIAQLDAASDALALARRTAAHHRAVANLLASGATLDPAAIVAEAAAVDREIAIAEHRAEAVRQQLGLAPVEALH